MTAQLKKTMSGPCEIKNINPIIVEEKLYM
jgi:hypothetical protein